MYERQLSVAFSPELGVTVHGVGNRSELCGLDEVHFWRHMRTTDVIVALVLGWHHHPDPELLAWHTHVPEGRGKQHRTGRKRTGCDRDRMGRRM